MPQVLDRLEPVSDALADCFDGVAGVVLHILERFHGDAGDAGVRAVAGTMTRAWPVVAA